MTGWPNIPKPSRDWRALDLQLGVSPSMSDAGHLGLDHLLLALKPDPLVPECSIGLEIGL